MLFMISSGLEYLFDKIVVVKILISRIFMYSAMKINANGELLYSMLKPDTSSDSPSVKSNGVRCVSARIEIIHAVARGVSSNIVQEY